MKLRRLHRILAGACFAFACLSWPGPASADEKVVLAQQAFDAGMRLTKQGNYKEACPKFEESQKQDPQIGTLFYLADCQEHIDLLASAWANFIATADKAAAAGKPSHAAEARARADALKVRLNKLLILVPEEVQKVEGFEIRKGDIVLGPSQLGTAFPVDNGKHEIKVRATGHRAWSTTVEIGGESSTITVSVPLLQAEPVVGPVATAKPTAVPQTPPPQPAGWSTHRKVALGLGGVGLAGLVVGGVMGGLAMDRWNSSGQFCQADPGGGPDQCFAQGVKIRDDARVFAVGANVGILAGAALATAGVVVWLVSPATESAAGFTQQRQASGSKWRVGIAGGEPGATLQFGREW